MFLQVVFAAWRRLPCSWLTMALLASYQVQSDLGDCVLPGDEPPRNEAGEEEENLEAISEQQVEYFARTLFVPAEQQTPEFVAKIHELWQSHRCALIFEYSSCENI